MLSRREYINAASAAVFLSANGSSGQGLTNGGDVLWKSDLDGKILYGPTVGQTYVYVVTKSNKLHAYNRGSGRGNKVKLKNRPAGPPVCVDESVVVADSGGNIYVYSDTVNYHYKTISLEHSIDSGVVVAHGNVYARTENGRVIAVDIKDETVVWKTSDAESFESEIIVRNGELLAISKGHIYALEAKQGTVVWKHESSENEFTQVPIPHNDRLFTTTRKGEVFSAPIDSFQEDEELEDKELYDIEDGEDEPYSQDTDDSDGSNDGDGDDGIGGDDDDDYNLSAITTDSVYTRSGNILVNNEDGVLCSISGRGSGKRWETTSAENGAVPETSDGRVYYSNGNKLVSYDLDDSEQEWKADTKPTTPVTPAESELFYGNGSTLHCVKSFSTSTGGAQSYEGLTGHSPTWRHEGQTIWTQEERKKYEPQPEPGTDDANETKNETKEEVDGWEPYPTNSSDMNTTNNASRPRDGLNNSQQNRDANATNTTSGDASSNTTSRDSNSSTKVVESSSGPIDANASDIQVPDSTGETVETGVDNAIDKLLISGVKIAGSVIGTGAAMTTTIIAMEGREDAESE